MRKFFTIVLKMAVIGAGIYAIAGMYKKGKLEPLLKKFKKIKDPLENGLYTKEQFVEIAKDLTAQIDATAERTSSNAHRKNQKKYDGINWSQKIISKMNNSLN